MGHFEDTATGARFTVDDEHDDLFATAQYKRVRGGRRAAQQSDGNESHPRTGSTPTQRAQN